MDKIPLLGIFAMLIVGSIIAVEAGYSFGGWYARDRGLDKYPNESSTRTSVLGLLAFVLAFAFGGSAGRYGDIRDLAREDTAAIEQVFQMCDFLDESDGGKMRGLLREYHAVRLHAIASQDTEKLAEALDRSQELHDEVWEMTVRLRKETEGSLLNPFVSAVRNMMDTHTKRVTKATITRLPGIIWWTLGGLLLLSTLMLGFTAGLHGQRSRLASAILCVSFSAVMLMIIDLDRPLRSLFRHQGDPLGEQLLEQMESRLKPQ